MERQLLIQKVKQLAGAANLEQALQLLDEYATSNIEKYDELHDQIVQARAQLSQTLKDQNAGVISFEEAKISLNQVTRQILAILDELEAEDRPAGAPGKKDRRPVWLAPSLAVAALVALGAIWWFFFQNGLDPTPEEPQGEDAAYCSGFMDTDADFRVLILPYFYIGRPLGSHNLVRLRLGELRDRYDIKLASEIYRDSSLSTSDRYPADSDQASVFGQRCNAQLIIWGTEEPRPNQNVITTRYKFLMGNENFELTKLKISDTGVDTVQSLSSILTQGAVTGEIEQIIKYLFGLIKFESGDYDEAIAALEEARIDAADSTAHLTKSMLLSDSYLKTGNEEKAMQSLDTALQAHPEYALALNNRAAFYFKKKKYEQAAEDLEMANRKLPNDTVVQSNRLLTNLAIERVWVAEEAVNKLKQIAPESRELIAKTPLIDSNIANIRERQENIISDQQRILTRNPGDVAALQEQAQAYLKLGNFDDAIRTANLILRQNGRNKTAYLILLKSYVELDRDREVVATLRRARENGLTERELLAEQPGLTRLIQEMRSRLNQ